MVALVTGGGRGIGRSIALRLSKEGWAVAVAARSADQLAETVTQAEGKMIPVQADMGDAASVKAMAEEVETKLGPVSLLVNNAGTTGPMGPFWENDPEEWWRCQEINLRGPMLCCREIVPGMISRKSGRIVNMSSGAGLRAVANMGAYAISKASLIRFSEQLAVELQTHGVSVFPIMPGMVKTAMVDQVRHFVPAVQKSLDEGLDVKPEKVAELVMFLASGRADALSGRVFYIHRDVEDLVRRADEVLKGELNLLRMREL